MSQHEAFIIYVSNQKQNDKFSLSYFIGMIDPHNVCHYYPDEHKRHELLTELCRLISIPGNLEKCIQSDYTRKQLDTIISTEREAEKAFFKSHPELNP